MSLTKWLTCHVMWVYCPDYYLYLTQPLNPYKLVTRRSSQEEADSQRKGMGPILRGQLATTKLAFVLACIRTCMAPSCQPSQMDAQIDGNAGEILIQRSENPRTQQATEEDRTEGPVDCLADSAQQANTARYHT